MWTVTVLRLQRSPDGAAAPEDADTLAFPEPFLFPEISNSHPWFLQHPRVSPVVLRTGTEFSKPFASNKNKHAEYSSFS